MSNFETDFFVGIVIEEDIIEFGTNWEAVKADIGNMEEFFQTPQADLRHDESPVEAARSFIQQGVNDLEDGDTSMVPLTLTATAYVIQNSLDDADTVKAVLIANYEGRLSLLCFDNMEKYQKAAQFFMQGGVADEETITTQPKPTIH